MIDNFIDFLASESLFRVMVFIWMLIITYWMRRTDKDIIGIYQHLLDLNRLKENKKDE